MTHPAEGSETAGELMPRTFPLPNTMAFERAVAATFDAVTRPAHYASGAIECADAIAVAVSGEADPEIAWCRGNAIKYLWRSGKKGNAAEDLRKAIWYIERAARKLEAAA